MRHRNLPLAGILLCEARTFLSQPVSLRWQRPHPILDTTFYLRNPAPSSTRGLLGAYSSADVEAAAADEFPYDGVLRDQLRADREEVDR